MKSLECPECGEVFSYEDVVWSITTYGFMECQRCYEEITVDEFDKLMFHPFTIETETDRADETLKISAEGTKIYLYQDGHIEIYKREEEE